MRQTIECVACGERNVPEAAYCAACGARVGVGAHVDVMAGADSLANEVAGAPVRQEQRRPAGTLADVGARAQATARARVQEVLPEVTATMVESVNRLAGLAGDPRRVAQWQRRAEAWRARALTWSQGQSPVPVTPAPAPVPMAARVVWFVLVGSWLTCLWVVAIWLTMLTVVGRPLARRMLDLAPTVLTLRPAHLAAERWRRQAALRAAIRRPQPDLTARILYFTFVGWWASLVWLLGAYALSLTAVGLPVGYTMFDLTPSVAYLERR